MAAAPAVTPVVRAILTENINLSADEVIRKAKQRGVTAPEASIRTLAHNIKSTLKKEAAKGGGKTATPKPSSQKASAPKSSSPKPSSPKPVPAAARATKSVVQEVAAPAPTPAALPGLDLSAVLANVALVNAVVGACGGPEQARKVAEAVKACGGVEAFLQHLELVAQVRG